MPPQKHMGKKMIHYFVTYLIKILVINTVYLGCPLLPACITYCMQVYLFVLMNTDVLTYMQ
jgi:hypothetical protein